MTCVNVKKFYCLLVDWLRRDNNHTPTASSWLPTSVQLDLLSQVRHLFKWAELRTESLQRHKVEKLKTSFYSSQDVVQVGQKNRKNTAPASQLDFFLYFSKKTQSETNQQKNVQRVVCARARGENKMPCCQIKQYWYQDHWWVCVCLVSSGSPEMLQLRFCFPLLLPFISSPLLLENRSRVKCEVVLLYEMKFLPNDDRRSCLLFGSLLAVSLPPPVTLHGTSKQRVTAAPWEGVPCRSLLKPSAGTFPPRKEGLLPVCLFLESWSF